MIAITLSDAATDTLRRHGFDPEAQPLFWQGTLPSLQRLDDKLCVLDPERRARLNQISRDGCENLGALTARDHAFYGGLVAEITAVAVGECGDAS